jgi:DDB1- and CUL4-associated factor 6
MLFNVCLLRNPSMLTCIAHPYEPMLAVSGIDSTVKIFSPDGRARRDAALARNGVSAADTSTFASIGIRRDSDDEESEEEDITGSNSSDAEESDDEGESLRVSENGLKSRKMMKKEYHITTANDMTRRNEMQQHNIRSQGVYQLLAAQLAAQLGRGVDGTEDDNGCRLM